MAARVKHGTLTANTIATVTLTLPWNLVEILNRGTDSIYLSLINNTPTVAGDDFDVVPSGTASTFQVPTQYEQGSTVIVAPTTTVVYLISASATPYSITGS